MCKFQGSSANSVGGDSGRSKKRKRRTIQYPNAFEITTRHFSIRMLRLKKNIIDESTFNEILAQVRNSYEKQLANYEGI